MSIPAPAEVPVTVSITRRVDPDHAAEMVAWVRSGSLLAERFEGFLGTGWVRPSRNSDQWHMLYRFDSSAALARWEASDQRRWWLSSAQGIVEDTRVERLTGIEGWFDPPEEYAVEQLAPRKPPRWKQAVMIWFAFFPLSLAIALLAGWLVPDLDVVSRVLVSTVVMTPIMTYLVLPFLTSRLDWWLHGRPAPWRR